QSENALEANRVFTTNYLQQTKKQASLFSLLGWESGLLIQKVIGLRDDLIFDCFSLVEKLKTMMIESPRGELKFDVQTNNFIAPVLRKSISNNSNTSD